MVSKYVLLSSQDFIEGRLAHVGDYVCRNVARQHLAWVGVFASIPPHLLTRSCTYMRLLAYVGHGKAINNKYGSIYVLYMGVGHVQHFDCTWWEGVTVTPLPIDWVMHTRYHLPTQYSVSISK